MECPLEGRSAQPPRDKDLDNLQVLNLILVMEGLSNRADSLAAG